MAALSQAPPVSGKATGQVATAPVIPLTFPSMALTWAEFDELRTLIRANCALADSDDFRSNPAAHKTCTR